MFAILSDVWVDNAEVIPFSSRLFQPRFNFFLELEKADGFMVHCRKDHGKVNYRFEWI